MLPPQRYSGAAVCQLKSAAALALRAGKGAFGVSKQFRFGQGFWQGGAIEVDEGLLKLTAENRRDLLEVLEDRYGSRFTLATRQLPIDQWHNVIGDPTLADAILDRLVHNAYKINLRGGSMRKAQSKLTNTAQQD